MSYSFSCLEEGFIVYWTTHLLLCAHNYLHLFIAGGCLVWSTFTRFAVCQQSYGITDIHYSPYFKYISGLGCSALSEISWTPLYKELYLPTG